MKRAGLIAGILAVSLLNTTVVRASERHSDQHYGDWHYSLDAVGDSNDGRIYDIEAIAIKSTPESVYVSISGNLPLSGIHNSRAEDQHIGWGDLFFDFSGDTFESANNNQSLFAVKFAEGTNSGVTQTGVYSNVSAKSVGPENDGFRTLEEYYEEGLERAYTLGSAFVDSSSAYAYYSGKENDSGKEDDSATQTPINNVIKEGVRIGGIRLLNEQEAAMAGVDFAALQAVGDAQITFQFDRQLLPDGTFVANVFIECANDGVAIIGHLSPEPLAPGSSVVVGGRGTGGGAITGKSTRHLSSSSFTKIGHSATKTHPPSSSPPHSNEGESNEGDPELSKITGENMPTPIPEPSTFAGLALLSLCGLGLGKRPKDD